MTYLSYPIEQQIPAWGMGQDLSTSPSRENAREFLRKLIKRIYSDEITPENLKADAEESGIDVKTAEAIVKLVAATPETLKRLIGEENYKKLDEAHENKYGAGANEKQENKSDIPILGSVLNKAGSFAKQHPTATLLGLAALNAALSKSPEAGERMVSAIYTGHKMRQEKEEEKRKRWEEVLQIASEFAKEERQAKEKGLEKSYELAEKLGKRFYEVPQGLESVASGLWPGMVQEFTLGGRTPEGGRLVRGLPVPPKEIKKASTWKLDWEYSEDGTKRRRVRVNLDTGERIPITGSKWIPVSKFIGDKSISWDDIVKQYPILKKAQEVDANAVVAIQKAIAEINNPDTPQARKERLRNIVNAGIDKLLELVLQKENE